VSSTLHKCKKTTFIETVIGDVVAHLKLPKFTVLSDLLCILFHHYSASSILLSM